MLKIEARKKTLASDLRFLLDKRQSGCLAGASGAHIWRRVQEIENYVRNPFMQVTIMVSNGSLDKEIQELRD